MSETPAVSLVVVSRGRPLELSRALRSFSDLDYRPFEVIVVSEINPISAFPDLPNITNVIHVPFDRANISAARNLGIDAASGEIIAFCDDDAVPEPTWLCHLIAPFENPDVGAAGGFVRGRNGISFQWKASRFDRAGFSEPFEIDGDAPVVLQGTIDFGIKTEGTNCAFRRTTLAALNGFDEGFEFFLDETDLNYRLGLAGWKTAIVPRAQVHHGYAANSVRKTNRAPTSLAQIAASQARFCALHLVPSEQENAMQAFVEAQRKRLISHMIARRLEPGEVQRMLGELKATLIPQAEAAAFEGRTIAPSPKKFQPFLTTPPKTNIAVYALGRQVENLKTLDEETLVSDYNITIFLFSLTTFFHRMSYDPRGFWVQRGGLFGRSDRGDAFFKFSRIKARAVREVARMARIRPLSPPMTLRSFLEKPKQLP